MEIHRGKEINVDKWKILFKKSDYATPFQTLECAEFFSKQKNYATKIYAMGDGAEYFSACVVVIIKEKGIKGFFSRRAIIYGGPVIAPGEDGAVALKELLNSINENLCDSVIYSSIRNYSDYDNYKKTFVENGWEYQQHLNIKISLKGRTIENMLQGMKYNRRREIKLSIKEGAIYRQAESLTEIDEVYNILKELYETRVMLPLPKLDFFRAFYQSPISKVFVVVHNNHIIGGSFCIYSPGRSINTMYYCGIRNYHKSVFPTHLSILAAINFGIENDLDTLDMNGAGKPNEDYGVRDYKSQFGGDLVEHGRFLKIFKPGMYSLGKKGLQILKRIKN